MPFPVRTGLVLQCELIEDEPAEAEVKAPGQDDGEAAVETRPGMPLKNDPCGRDDPRRSEHSGHWSVEPLTKYLKSIVRKIESNLRDKRLPTAEKLDTFVSGLVATTQRQLRHAPRKVRPVLQAMFSKRFQSFWNFVPNEKVRSTAPEELKLALTGLIEALVQFSVTSDAALAQPQPMRYERAKSQRQIGSSVSVIDCG